MTRRLDDDDDALLSRHAADHRRSKQEIAREAIHVYLTDEARRLEDAEDELALSRFLVRQQLGEVRWFTQREVRAQLGLLDE